MKLWIHLALALLVVAGAMHDGGVPVGADTNNYDFDTDSAATHVVDPIYFDEGPDGIAAHFGAHPITLGAFDVFNGREIVGWSVHCEGECVATASTGQPSTSARAITRAFGTIVVRYE
jgi:hypothetical protein